jgi:hypothetical protein
LEAAFKQALETACWRNHPLCLQVLTPERAKADSVGR